MEPGKHQNWMKSLQKNLIGLVQEKNGRGKGSLREGNR